MHLLLDNVPCQLGLDSQIYCWPYLPADVEPNAILIEQAPLAMQHPMHDCIRTVEAPWLASSILQAT